MKVDKIITCVDSSFKIPFLAMERSLRATGSRLPLLVIPYTDNKFELPELSEWWEIPELINFLNKNGKNPGLRKFQCLTTSNYQYIDSDVCFLKNPAEALSPFDGFVTCCGHWRNPTHATTEKNVLLLKQKSTMWQKNIFNSGQFASDQALFTVENLIRKITEPDFIDTCLNSPVHEQPAMNLLVATHSIKFTNITLPPYNFESSWAGDYKDNIGFNLLNSPKGPYMVHWAGFPLIYTDKINNIFYSYMTEKEKNEWLSKGKFKVTKLQQLQFLSNKIKSFIGSLFI